MRSVGHCAIVLFATFALAIAALTCNPGKAPSQSSATPEQVEPSALEEFGVPPESRTTTSDRTVSLIPAAPRRSYPGASDAPHHLSKEWLGMFEGKVGAEIDGITISISEPNSR